MLLRTILLLFVISLATVSECWSSADRDAKALAIYAPQPRYPSLPNGKKPEGSGMFVFHIDPRTGAVRSVSVEKGTGFAILDKAAIDAFRRWKFRPGTPTAKIPMTFTAHELSY
jgi:TonB family protein